jgi:hypothetical protein
MACWSKEVQYTVGTATKFQDTSSYSNPSHVERRKISVRYVQNMYSVFIMSYR